MGSACGNEKQLQTISRLGVRPQAEQAGLEVPSAQFLLDKFLWGNPGWALTLAPQRYGEITSPCWRAAVTPSSSGLDLCKL